MERSLNERFIEFESRMASIDNLTKYGTANDLKFYIFDYNPKDEIRVRKEVKKVLNANNSIIEFDLYEMMLEIIKENGYEEEIQNLEKQYSKELLLSEIFQPILSVEESNNSFLDLFRKKAPDDGEHIVLITGVGKVYPIVRSHTILNNLQSVFRRNPVVMMYPGRYEIKSKMTLKLFERLDDDNYYRAFPLVERRGASNDN